LSNTIHDHWDATIVEPKCSALYIHLEFHGRSKP
jgi:hypothetical protein